MPRKFPADGAGSEMTTRIVYSIAEACAIAGIRRTSLYNAIRAGDLRAIKIGGRTFILARDLYRWLHGMPPIPPKQSAPSETACDRSVIVRDKPEA
jgi:excisionase family DNA binding protein